MVNKRCLLTCVLMVSVRARYQSLITLSISDWISSSVPCRVFSWGRERQHLTTLKPKLQVNLKIQQQVGCVQYLDDVFLARLVLRGPVHRPPPQIHSELRLGLVAPKLLESMKQNYSPCLTQRRYNRDTSLFKGHLLCKIHFFMYFIHKHVSPLCKEILKVSEKKFALWVLIYLYKNLSENKLIVFTDIWNFFWVSISQ